MPVPAALSDLSQTAGSNSPAGGESPTTADDYFRAHASFLALLRDGKGFTPEVDLLSAATTDIGAANSAFVRITGTTTITSFGTAYNGPRFIRFSGALTLTNSATLVLPGGVSITTAAGDTCIAVPITGGGWQVYGYQIASSAPSGTATGSVHYFPAVNAPTGFLKANGSLVSRSTYPALWAFAQASGNISANDAAWTSGQFSPGDGATTFRIPDLRGYHVRSYDDSRGVDAGRTIGSVQADQMPSHGHSATVTDPGHTHQWGVNSQNAGAAGAGNLGGSGAGTASATSSSTTGVTVAISATGTGTETRVKTIALLACIKF